MLVLTIGGAILGYGAMAGATHALLSRIWKPVKAAREATTSRCTKQTIQN